MNNETKKGKMVPELRFPGFEGEWEVLELGQICSVNRGVRVTRKDLDKEGKYPVFQNTNSPMGYFNSFNVTANNPFVIIGGSAGTMGFCKTNFWAADDCAYFGENELLDKCFLYATLLTHELDIKNSIRGGNIPRIDRKSIEKIKVALPSLPEQQKIAECLSSVDDLIQAEADQLQALKDHKKGLMQQLFPISNEQLAMSNGNPHIPRLRFPGFEGEWEEKKLGEIADKCTSRNRDKSETRVLTNSATEGVVDQNAYFDRDIAVKENTDNYHVVDLDDFVYNPRISTSAPVGPISRNKIGRGIMSPLYSVFRFKSENIDYLEHFFSTTIWHRYLKSVANYGARFDRMAISTEDFYSMPILCPDPSEQQKIAECLSSLDEGIAAQQEKVEALKKHKKGLMQKLFPNLQ